MPISAEQFREALLKVENGEELLEFHAGAVAAEKTTGITKHREANKEAQNLRKFKIAMEKMGYDPASQADVEAFADGIMEQIEQSGTKTTTELTDLQKTLSKLQKDFTKSQTELTAEREQRSSLEKLNKTKTIEAKLLPKLQEDFYGANFIVKALLADGLVDLDETGEVIFRNGDQVVPMADGLKTIAEQNADARKNRQTGGAGSSASVQTARPKFTIDQIKAMNPEQMKANIADVNESMRVLSAAAK